MSTEHPPPPAPACQVCGQSRLREVDGFAGLPRITSDCRAHPPGGSLHVCLACGSVQKLADGKWLDEIASIYAGYEAYYQSGGDEQIVFDRVSGKPRRRSEVILGNLAAGGGLVPRGRALDVGCGNGATLAAMSAMLGGWTLSGYELGEGALERLKTIPRFERLYTGDLDAIGAQFDLVTMIHSLEHFPSPAKALQRLLPIVGGGKIFIEVCNVEENPFDILVADHLMHFSPATLSLLLHRCGLVPTMVATDWVPKEISALAHAADRGDRGIPAASGGSSDLAGAAFRRISGHVSWLRKMTDAVGEHARNGNFGIFGTSIAATWIASQMQGRIEFFVDEDESRVGKMHMGRPVLHPEKVPPRSTVYLALAPQVAAMIASRLSYLPCTLVAPPALNAV